MVRPSAQLAATTIKDPKTGLSIDLKRPDFQIFDKATGQLVKIIEAKSSNSMGGCSAWPEKQSPSTLGPG